MTVTNILELIGAWVVVSVLMLLLVLALPGVITRLDQWRADRRAARNTRQAVNAFLRDERRRERAKARTR